MIASVALPESFDDGRPAPSFADYVAEDARASWGGASLPLPLTKSGDGIAAAAWQRRQAYGNARGVAAAAAYASPSVDAGERRRQWQLLGDMNRMRYSGDTSVLSSEGPNECGGASAPLDCRESIPVQACSQGYPRTVFPPVQRPGHTHAPTPCSPRKT